MRFQADAGRLAAGRRLDRSARCRGEWDGGRPERDDGGSRCDRGGLRRDGGPKSGGRGFPKERPFAHTALEAQSLIQEQIDEHMTPLLKCVNDFRQKKGDPHKPVVVEVGIDQEGNLLGVTSPNIKKGDLDPVMRDCMTTALRGLPFPKSHAGIITVRQTFSDVVVQQ